jgi:hypothetical protein
MKNFTFRTWTIPITLLVLCILSFGLLIPWLGFYWDDWPTMWYLHLMGPAGFKDVFQVDRPLLGWVYMFTSSLVGDSTLGWQLFGIFTHWLSALALWWTLRLLWPRYTLQVTIVSLLYLVYPGFKQQYIAVTYSTDWIALATFFLSFGLMLLAVRKPRWFWPLMAASWLTAALVMFADEYYFGLELLRPVFLWIAVSEKVSSIRKRIWRVLTLWAPYVAIMGIFLVWRLFLTVTPRGKVSIFDDLLGNPLSTILGLIRTIFLDALQSGVIAWLQTLNIPALNAPGSLPIWAYAGVVLIISVLMVFYLARLRVSSTDKPSDETLSSLNKYWALQAIAMGIFALLIAGWPFWTTNLPIGLEFPWDRFNLAMMLGSSLFLAGLLALLTRSQLQKAIVVGILIGLAAGLHLQNANTYRKEWNSQKEFFWQLTWRAPNIKPGTTVLGTELPFTYFSDNSLTGPLNWIYAPDSHSRQMSYMFYAAESRLGVRLDGFGKGQVINQPYRATHFTGSTSQALVIFYTPPGCIKVVDPNVDAKLPQKPKYIADAMRLSNISLIQANPQPGAQPPTQIFGPEPGHDWCYYFEKADLARQQGDWQSVVKLAKQAFGLNQRLYEVNAPELLPYIEGYARTGQWDKAEKLSMQSYDLTFRMRNMLCANWDRIAADTPPSAQKQAVLDKIDTKLKCP